MKRVMNRVSSQGTWLAGVLLAAAMLAGGADVDTAWACACGCGMYSVGMPGLGLPTASGLAINLQTTLLDQKQAMQGGSKIPLSQSADQRINTTFYNLNVQYQINRSWGIMTMIPYWQRKFDTTGAPRATVNTLSDIRVEGIYSGFSPDMSTGLIFGLKLPTGTHTATGFDRDTQPGTGTTDLLLGGYQWGSLAPNWNWSVQGMFRSAMNTRDGYRPGNSLHIVGNMHYDGFRSQYHFAPMLQVHYNYRLSDSGVNAANPVASGQRSIFVAPGILLNLSRHWSANAEVYIPAYYHVTGIQLVPKQVFSFGITYNM